MPRPKLRSGDSMGIGARMSDGRPVKRSLTLRGHRTSVSLEDAFWRAFRDIAAAEGKTINGLAVEVDEARGDVGLASAIRVFVLKRLIDRS